MSTESEVIIDAREKSGKKISESTSESTLFILLEITSMVSQLAISLLFVEHNEAVCANLIAICCSNCKKNAQPLLGFIVLATFSF